MLYNIQQNVLKELLSYYQFCYPVSISNSMNNTSEILRDYILLLLLIVNILILIMRSQTMYSAASPIIKCVNDFDMN